MTKATITHGPVIHDDTLTPGFYVTWSPADGDSYGTESRFDTLKQADLFAVETAASGHVAEWGGVFVGEVAPYTA